MKVFALGGYGKVGYPANKLLAQSDLVTEIAVVGRDLEKAEKAASEIGLKATAIQADGTDEKNLASLLAGYDLIINAAANRFVLPSINAAIHNHAHYCDAAYGEVLDQALRLTSAAESANIIAIVANGVHPSITNLMGVLVTRQLQEVEQLQLGDASMYNFRRGADLTPRQWLEEPRKSLDTLKEFMVGITWMWQLVLESGTKTALDFQDGEWVDLDPTTFGMDIPLLQGGTIFAYPYLSSAPLFGSLPRDLAKVSPVEMLFSPFPPQLHDVLRELSMDVLNGKVEPDAAIDSFLKTAQSDPDRYLTLPDDYRPIPKTWTCAVGRKAGRAARSSCWLTAPAWDVGGYLLTSVALAAAVLTILSGDVKKRGVLTAKEAFEPTAFFDNVAALLPEYLLDGKLINESFEWLE